MYHLLASCSLEQRAQRRDFSALKQGIVHCFLGGLSESQKGGFENGNQGSDVREGI